MTMTITATADDDDPPDSSVPVDSSGPAVVGVGVEAVGPWWFGPGSDAVGVGVLSSGSEGAEGAAVGSSVAWMRQGGELLRQLRLEFRMRAMQQLSGPPGRVRQPSPPHVPHDAAQQKFWDAGDDDTGALIPVP